VKPLRRHSARLTPLRLSVVRAAKAAQVPIARPRSCASKVAPMIASVLDQQMERGQLDVPDTGALARALNLMNESFLLDQFGQDPQGDPQTALATLETIWLRVLASQAPAR